MATVNRFTRATFLTAFVVVSTFAVAGNPSVRFEFRDVPTFIKVGSAFEPAVRIEGAPASVVLEYSLADGKVVTVEGKKDSQGSAVYRFTVPIPESAAGLLSYAVVADQVRSESHTIPIALEMELDITGDAAIALLYPIGGPEYTVRYVPCCNIFGGITMATRVPMNPEKSSVGLPEKTLSDFMVLSPDGLSASTMGMYMDFLLGPERFKKITPALYEFNGREWVEFRSYDVDPARGYISMHCPDGGTFVIAAKP